MTAGDRFTISGTIGRPSLVADRIWLVLDHIGEMSVGPETLAKIMAAQESGSGKMTDRQPDPIIEAAEELRSYWHKNVEFYKIWGSADRTGISGDIVRSLDLLVSKLKGEQ